MVFIAIILPRRAASINSTFEANLQGHANNTHCIGKCAVPRATPPETVQCYNNTLSTGRAVNQLAQAMFHVYTREQDVEDRLKEFLALASSSLLRLGQENDKETIRTRESIYLLLHIIVKESNVRLLVTSRTHAIDYLSTIALCLCRY